MHHIERVQKPRGYRQAKKNTWYYDFDDHYPLSTVYCQMIHAHTAIPRLVGPQCKQYEDNGGED